MNSFDVFVIKGFTVDNKLMMMQRKKQFTVARNPEGWSVTHCIFSKTVWDQHLNI